MPAPTFADTPPVPQKKADLKDLKIKLKSEQQAKNHLEEKIEGIEKDIGKTKKELVDLAASIQKNETTLQGLETQITDLEQEKSSIENTLKTDRQSIAKLVMALQRIRRVPPEALVVKPGAPLKTAQSAMLMKDIIPAINARAEVLRVNLSKLEVVSKELNEKRDKVARNTEELKSRHLKLSSLIAKREKLYKSTRNDLKAQEQNIQRISMHAENLQDLVKKLDENKKRQAASRLARNALFSDRVRNVPDAGRFQLPVSGIIKTRYNEPDIFGAPSKGLSIEGRGGALVVAPMGGVVRFSGYFKNYGNMVILEHKDGLHSLVAGLEKIDTVVGQNVSAGEPLGLLHHAQSGGKPVLYYELRQGGKPINPAKKFVDLG